MLATLSKGPPSRIDDAHLLARATLPSTPEARHNTTSQTPPRHHGELRLETLIHKRQNPAGATRTNNEKNEDRALQKLLNLLLCLAPLVTYGQEVTPGYELQGDVQCRITAGRQVRHFNSTFVLTVRDSRWKITLRPEHWDSVTLTGMPFSSPTYVDLAYDGSNIYHHVFYQRTVSSPKRGPEVGDRWPDSFPHPDHLAAPRELISIWYTLASSQYWPTVTNSQIVPLDTIADGYGRMSRTRARYEISRQPPYLPVSISTIRPLTVGSSTKQVLAELRVHAATNWNGFHLPTRVSVAYTNQFLGDGPYANLDIMVHSVTPVPNHAQAWIPKLVGTAEIRDRTSASNASVGVAMSRASQWPPSGSKVWYYVDPAKQSPKGGTWRRTIVVAGFLAVTAIAAVAIWRSARRQQQQTKQN